MSAGSDASNLGYGNITPLSNINGKYVNVHNSHDSANFSSNQIPGLPGLAGAKNNADAANGYVPGICLFKGGSRKSFKRKLKKISNKYKMNSIKYSRRVKSKLRNKYLHSKKRFSKKRNSRRVKKHRSYKSKSRAKKSRSIAKKSRKHRRHSMKGGQIPTGNIPYPPGYAQYQNNLPHSATYSIGGELNASSSALANPPPFKVESNCTNCVDNYNHFTGKGFPSRGH
jgi:hypothetical protein